MARTHFLFLALAAGFCLPQWALAFNVYKVGGDVDCPYTNIQDAIDAAAANPGADYVWIAMNGTYTGQHVLVDNDTDGVIIVGGLVDCNDNNVDTATTTVSGAGNDGSAVFTIRGNSSVLLQNLFITGAQRDGGASGGGVDFDGSGFLGLRLSSISLNSAGYGGGINANGDGGHVDVVLEDNSLVLNNTAQTSGGGIRVEGDTRLYALQPQTLIGFNHAPNGYGGGIEVLGPARADVGSPGYNGVGVIYDNDAQYGGGIDILTFDDGANAIVRLFTTDPNNPVQISGNFASHTGGAVYLRPLYDLFSQAASVLCAYDFRIEDNAAQEGAAIYSDADYTVDSAHGGFIALNTNPASFESLCVQTEAPPALGAVACAAGVPCNQIVGNQAQDQNGQPTAGSTILLQNGSDLEGDRFSARANTGAHVVREIGDVNFASSGAELSNCLFTGNTLTQELIAQTDGTSAYLTLDSCTIAGNQIGAPYALLAPGFMALFNSIIDQPGRATVDPTITDPNAAAYVLTNDRSTLPDTAYIDEGEPTFVDAANGDYHLVPTSLGIDFAPIEGTGYPTLDLDRKPRVVDLPHAANNFGPMDLGAYEIQLSTVLACANADTIFCDGFDAQ